MNINDKAHPSSRRLFQKTERVSTETHFIFHFHKYRLHSLSIVWVSAGKVCNDVSERYDSRDYNDAQVHYIRKRSAEEHTSENNHNNNNNNIRKRSLEQHSSEKQNETE